MTDPTSLEGSGRRRVLAGLAATADAVTTKELAESLGMHRNGVRAHLLRLGADGLVGARRVARGRGRPRDEWTLTGEGRALLADGAATADLSRWLAEVLADRPDMLGDIEDAGRRLGEQLGADSASIDVRPALLETFEALGFAPRLEDETGTDITLRLCHCPYRDAAASAGDVICGLHRGITEGVLASVAPTAALTSFEPHDPYEAGCVVRIATAPAT
jgi:predicted ArsR family transcriptional regulator